MDDTLYAAIQTGSPFAILAVRPDCSDTDIIIGCERASRCCHGEKHVIALVEKARDTLLDPWKRKSYEESQERKAKAAAEKAAKLAAGPFEGDALIAFEEPSRDASPARSASTTSSGSEDGLAEPSLLDEPVDQLSPIMLDQADQPGTIVRTASMPGAWV